MANLGDDIALNGAEVEIEMHGALNEDDIARPGDTGLQDGIKDSTATPTVRKREKYSRRVNGYIDGLKHLSVSRPVDIQTTEATDSNEIELLRDVVFCLVRLDLWTLTLLDMAGKGLFNVMLSTSEELENFRGHLAPGVKEIHLFDKSLLYEGSALQDQTIRQYVDGLSKKLLLDLLHQESTFPYYPRLLEILLSFCEIFNSFQKVTENCRGLDLNINDRISRLVKYSRIVRRRLKTILSICSQLLDHIVGGISAGTIDALSIDRLKPKIESLQINFPDACKEIEGEPRDLVDPRTRWWDPDGKMLSKNFADKTPKNVALAFPPSSNRNASLNLVVPLVTALSLVPAVLAWTRSSHDVGTVDDANFWQLISGSALQLLSIYTMMISTISNMRLVQHAWLWVWVLAGFGASCAVLAVPLYLYVPTEWSAAASFGSSVCQTLVTLQLVFAI